MIGQGAESAHKKAGGGIPGDLQNQLRNNTPPNPTPQLRRPQHGEDKQILLLLSQFAT